MKKRHQIAGSALGLLLLATSGSALAQDATPTDGPSLFPASCAVVAEGLNDPRFLALGPDGTLYVTEAGNGGTELMGSVSPATPAAGTPVVGEGEGGEEPPPTRGTSGQVTAISPDGTQSVLVDGLPSYGGVGPVGIIAGEDTLTITLGGGAPAVAEMLGEAVDPLPFENSVVSIDLATGDATTIAYLGQYEVDNNPDGTDVNPNLYQLAQGPDGLLYVADAGGNTIYTVDPATGSFELLAIVPPLSVLTGGSPVAVEEDRQPVPLGVGFDASGQLYVSLLAEEWAGPTLLRLETDGSWTTIASDMAFSFGFSNGPDGALYLVQGTTGFDEMGNPLPGQVLRVDADGTLTPVVDGLFIPIGSAVDAGGSVYVTVNSIAFGPGEPSGMVVRCDGAAAAA